MIRTILTSGILFLCLAAALPAQETSGSITGTVTDKQGGAIAGARVTLTDQNQATTRTQLSKSEGGFVFTSLPPSTYSVVVEAPGFKKFQVSAIVLDPNAAFGLPAIGLDVGAVNETVTIQANAVQLQTESADRSSVLTGQQIVDLPIVDRGFMGLLSTVPGSVNASRYTANVNGARNDQLSVKLDGISNMDSGVNQCCATWVNVDTIAEFKVISNSQTADIGHAGGPSISVVTKGGTKEFHGSGYFFLRNESLNANTWLNNINNARKPTYRYNTEGFTLGGPAYIPRLFNKDKNKLFFFASEEFQHQLNPVNGGNTYTVTVPTAAERGGDFSRTVFSNGQPVTIKDPLTGAPFAGNRIPSSRISKDGQALLNFFPSPNFTGSNAYNYTNSQSGRTPDTIGTYRIDDNISDRWHAYVRLTSDEQTTTGYYGLSGNIAGLGVSSTPRHGKAGAVNVTTIISPTFTNEFLFGVSQSLIINNIQNYQPYTRSALGLGYQPLYPGAVVLDLGPQVSFGGVSNAPSLGTGLPNIADNTNFNFVDNVSKVFNRHVVKIGVSIERDRKDQSNNNPVGAINFGQDNNNPLDSGYAFSNALLGNYDQYTQASAQLLGKYRFTNAEWYVADTWKARKNLTLDLGIRFYIVQPIYDVKNQIGTFNPSLWNPAQAVSLYQRKINPATGQAAAYNPINGTFGLPVLIGAIIPGSGNINNGFVTAGQNGYPRGLLQSRGVQYGPRFGLAYAFRPTTVFRMGFGTYYDRIEGNTTYNSLNFPPTVRTPTLYYGSLSSLGSAGQNLFPPNLNGGYSGDGHVPTVYNYNASIQHQLPSQILLDVAYVGSITRHLIQLFPFNTPAFGSAWLPQNQDPTVTAKYDGTTTLPTNFYRPYVGVGTLVMATNGASSNYNALQVTANRRFSGGLQMGVAYTFSKVLGTADSIYNQSANPLSVRGANYGRLSYDVPQNLVVNFTYSAPKAARGFLNNAAGRTVLNGWQLSGICSFQSGFPGTVGYNVNGVGSLSSIVTGNPDYGPRVAIAGNPNSGPRSAYQWINTGIYSPAAKGSTGNDSSYDYVNLPGVDNYNLVMMKNVALSANESRRLQFRLEGYNAFNHTQFSTVNTTATFASLTSNAVTNLPSATNRFGFGAVNGVRGARVVQLSVKLYF